MRVDGIPAQGPLLPLMRTVWLQVLRRKDMYLLAFVMMVFGAGSLAARAFGSETVEMVLFIGSLGYTLSWGLSAALAIIVASRAIPAEIESRTIYPVLAKPVTRAEFVAGRHLPVLFASAFFYFSCVAVTFLITPKLPHQSIPALMQALFLGLLSLAMLVAMMIAFSLLMPSSLTMVVGFLVYFGSGPLMNALLQVSQGAFWGGMLRGFPDFSLLDQTQRYIDGAVPMAPAEFMVVAVYGAAWTIVFSGIALWRFSRRAL